MAPIQSDGNPTKRTATKMRDAGIEQLRIKFGPETDVNASPDRKIIEAGLGMPITELDFDIEDAVLQLFPSTSRGSTLRAHLEDWLGFDKLLAARATGTVNLTLKASKSDSDFNPMFQAGTVVFVDTSGNKYDLIEDVVLGATATTTATAKVRAQIAGAQGNAKASSILKASTEFTTTAAQTRWADHIDTATNNAAFTGGRDEEDDGDYLARYQNAKAAGPDSTPDGVVQALLLADIGVTFADIIVNRGQTTGKEDTHLDDTGTGTASETIDGTTTKIARKFTVSHRRMLQHFLAKLAADTSFVCKVRIETDNSGSPSGTLADPSLEKSNFSFGGTAEVSSQTEHGAYVNAGTYWLVFERTSGSATFDGATGGTAGDVKVFNGSWANAATITKMRSKVIGGVPAGGGRVIVEGGTLDEIAQVIHDTFPLSATDDGKDSGTAKDKADRNVTRYCERPSNTEVVLKVTVTKLSTFGGDADTIRDVIVEYIGGTTTDSGSEPGLGVGKKIITHEIRARLLEDDRVFGLEDVPTVLLERQSVRATTGDLVAGDTANLVPKTGEKFTISDPATQIAVEINTA